MVFGSTPFGGLLWPLFIASANAIVASDREIGRKVLNQLLSVQRMGNIENAKELLEEVWRRSDSSSSPIFWREVARITDKSILLF